MEVARRGVPTSPKKRPGNAGKVMVCGCFTIGVGEVVGVGVCEGEAIGEYALGCCGRSKGARSRGAAGSTTSGCARNQPIAATR